MRKTSMTGKLIATGMAGLLFAGVSAQADIWTGLGDGSSFQDGANWQNGSVPATADINGAFTVTRDVDVTVGRTFVNGGATMNIASGVHSDGQSGAGTRNFIGGGSVGVVNQSGGSYDVGHSIVVGNGATGDGTYNLTGGDLVASRGSNSVVDGSNPFGRPSLDVSGGGAAGLFEISGGSFATRGPAYIGTGGTFSVVGNAATSIGIGSNGSGDGAWLQQTGAILKMQISAGGAVTPIFIDDVDGNNTAALFDSGSLLDVSFEGSDFIGTWTLLELENNDITNAGLALTGGVAAGWSFDVDNSGANGLLTASYVPEPTTFVMLVGGLGMLVMRRRRS